MRRRAWSGLSVLCCTALITGAAFAEATLTPPPLPDAFSNPNYDEVVMDLLANLRQGPAAAQDAAIKLGGLGKRALPALVDTLNANYGKDKDKDNFQIMTCTLVALARIRSNDAARALLPILSNPKAPAEFREIAVTAISLEYSDEAVTTLTKLATKDPDVDLRRKALNRLMTMPKQWMACEKLFLDSLSDDDVEIRAIAAKQCYFASKVYRDAAAPVIACVEKENSEAVRTQLFLALGRMQAKESVPALYRISSAGAGSPAMQKLVMRTINSITGIEFKDQDALQRWWEKSGKDEYEKYEQAMKTVQQEQAKAGGGEGSVPGPASTKVEGGTAGRDGK